MDPQQRWRSGSYLDFGNEKGNQTQMLWSTRQSGRVPRSICTRSSPLTYTRHAQLFYLSRLTLEELEDANGRGAAMSSSSAHMARCLSYLATGDGSYPSLDPASACATHSWTTSPLSDTLTVSPSP